MRYAGQGHLYVRTLRLAVQLGANQASKYAERLSRQEPRWRIWVEMHMSNQSMCHANGLLALLASRTHEHVCCCVVQGLTGQCFRLDGGCLQSHWVHLAMLTGAVMSVGQGFFVIDTARGLRQRVELQRTIGPRRGPTQRSLCFSLLAPIIVGRQVEVALLTPRTVDQGPLKPYADREAYTIPGRSRCASSGEKPLEAIDPAQRFGNS